VPPWRHGPFVSSTGRWEQEDVDSWQSAAAGLAFDVAVLLGSYGKDKAAEHCWASQTVAPGELGAPLDDRHRARQFALAEPVAHQGGRLPCDDASVLQPIARATRAA
jgi:hypothetical protein